MVAAIDRVGLQSYGAASCLRSEALQIERLHEILECTEVRTRLAFCCDAFADILRTDFTLQYAVLVREDATRRHQEHLKAAIEPQVQELLRMAEERQMEREKLAEKLRRKVRLHGVFLSI